MAQTATRIAEVIYDAARQRFVAGVELFAPGLPVPMRVAVILHAPPWMEHGALVAGLVRQAQAAVLRPDRFAGG